MLLAALGISAMAEPHVCSKSAECGVVFRPVKRVHLHGCHNVGTTFATGKMPCLARNASLRINTDAKHDGCYLDNLNTYARMTLVDMKNYVLGKSRQTCHGSCIHAVIVRHPASCGLGDTSPRTHDERLSHGERSHSGVSNTSLSLWNLYYGTWARLAALDDGPKVAVFRSEDILRDRCAACSKGSTCEEVARYYTSRLRKWSLPSSLRQTLDTKVLEFYDYTVNWIEG